MADPFQKPDFNDHHTRIVVLEKDVSRHSTEILDLKEVHKEQTTILTAIKEEIVAARSAAGTLIKVLTIVGILASSVYYIHSIESSDQPQTQIKRN